MTEQESARNRLDLEEELEPTLSHINPEVREEIQALEHTGHPREAEEELIDYVVTEDHSKIVRRLWRKKSLRDELLMDSRMFWLVAILTVVLLAGVGWMLFRGR
jgi:hypothetical protein